MENIDKNPELDPSALGLGAIQMRMLFEGYVSAGFDEEQSMRLIIAMIQGSLNS